MQHFLKYSAFFILVVFSRCKENSTSVHVEVKTDSVVTNTTSIASDTNQYLYDFIKMVEKDQKLDYSYGLTLEVNSTLSSIEDESYLYQFLQKDVKPIKKEMPKKKADSKDSSQTALQDTPIFVLTPREPFIITSTLSSLSPNYIDSECLTKADINYMLAEKRRLLNFKWDNLRLGFNLANENNWYVFSLPYFSKDKKTALICIRSLCKPFLCGDGYVLLYKYEDNKWISNKVNYWIH